MTERVFRDARGAEWRVLEVRPTHRDRRRGEERRRTQASARAPRPAVERRRAPDRRVRPGARHLLGETFQGGWLCFLPGDGTGTRRRVAPIPPRWEALSDRELARFVEAPPKAASPDGRGG